MSRIEGTRRTDRTHSNRPVAWRWGAGRFLIGGVLLPIFLSTLPLFGEEVQDVPAAVLDTIEAIGNSYIGFDDLREPGSLKIEQVGARAIDASLSSFGIASESATVWWITSQTVQWSTRSDCSPPMQLGVMIDSTSRTFLFASLRSDASDPSEDISEAFDKFNSAFSGSRWEVNGYAAHPPAKTLRAVLIEGPTISRRCHAKGIFAWYLSLSAGNDTTGHYWCIMDQHVPLFGWQRHATDTIYTTYLTVYDAVTAEPVMITTLD